MLLDIIILVLRETVEAGVFLSVLLCVSNQNKLTLKWLWTGLVFGCFAAVIYAANFGTLSEMLDYAGQEVLNASMLLIIYICILTICASLLRSKQFLKQPYIVPIMTITIGLTITRELAEMIIFYTGLFQSQDDIVKGLTSGFVGLMVGSSIGVLCYAGIISWRPSISRRIQIVLLTFIAAGLSVEATQQLIQIDWISASTPLWDTSWILSESSITGQMTYAVLGYEATPTKPELFFYITTLLFISILILINSVRVPHPQDRV